MQKIFVEKPYRFVKPVMNDWLPSVMNNRLIHIPLLRFGDDVISVECRGQDKLRRSLKNNDAIILVPNHPQTSDPVVMYDLMRRVKSPMFAMASWHLFHESWFHSAVIRLYGGFSINREGRDKTAINFSISALQDNRRPLLIFAEGATTRTNESMMPFLDGPSFIARTAARRRSKEGRKTFIFPIAIRYRFVDDSELIFNKLMSAVEGQLSVDSSSQCTADQRVKKSLLSFTNKIESEFGIRRSSDETPSDLASFCRELAELLMGDAEERHLGEISNENMTNRIRNLRANVFPELLSESSLSQDERENYWLDLKRTYRAWQLCSYPDSYLSSNLNESRKIELASKLFEDAMDQIPKCGRRRATISVCDPVEVPADKFRGGSGSDPLIAEIGSKLKAETAALSDQ